MTRDDKPKKQSSTSDTTSRPKPLVPKTALKKGTQYGRGGKLKRCGH